MILFPWSLYTNVLGDPVSASHCIVNLFAVVVSTQISLGRAVVNFAFLTSEKISGAVWLISAQSSERSFMYNADSGSTDSIYSSSRSCSFISCSWIWRTLSSLFCPWGRWYGPLWVRFRACNGGILDLHIFAKCPVFLQILHIACFVGHWFI